MQADKDISNTLAAAVRSAAAAHTPLAIHGSGSKHFLTGSASGTALDVTAHRGIVNYEPTELVITARAGTPLSEIEAALAEKNQMLGFEPPYFSATATLGGTIACNLSGPRRPYAGSARDFVLGMRIINGKGETLSFGGQVMKNVAGYDISRLMTGSLGTLGVILEVSLKVLPQPAKEITLAFEMSAHDAILKMNQWAGKPLPLSAAAYNSETLYIRLSGTVTGVEAAHAKLGGVIAKNINFWTELREQRLLFFQEETPLWRLSVPAATPPLDISGKSLLDWGGAQRWLKSNESAQEIRSKAQSVGGYAILFRDSRSSTRDKSELSKPAQLLQERIKHALDPAGILNC